MIANSSPRVGGARTGRSLAVHARPLQRSLVTRLLLGALLVPFSLAACSSNGSGVAALLEIAKDLAIDRAKNKFPRTIRFVAFTNEEPPFFRSDDMGSFRYAKACKERGDNIVAMLSLETIGYYSDKPDSQRFPVAALALLYPKTGNFLTFIGNAESGVTEQGLFEGRGPLAIILIVLLGGLALNLTPCVLPMIPINLAIIGAGAQAASRKRGFLLGLTYGGAMAFVYVPVSVVLMVASLPIIRLVFQTRSFTEESVRLTLSAFTWHIAGLYFIALNRIVAPAFYAQQDTKSPTYAGLFSFIVNIALALVLVGPMRGGGIALALSLASAANTAFLFLFMRKNGSISAGSILRSTFGYTLKMALFSALAAWPAALALPRLQARFAGSGRLIAQGVPLAGTLFLFAAAGVLLLAITRDQILLGVLSKLKNRGSGKN